ncbi:MAG: aminopeptidase [Deltaproteobacteria bacterium]|jgi:predicted aminopeptidase|nr:aminopeptidase [Deltaproteobacteria bacterium]
MMKPWKLFLFLTFMPFSLMGCGDLLYLSKLGWHQSSISFHSVPVQEVLDKKELGHEAKKRIHFIQEVKRYGEEKLGLRRTNSYSRYFEVKGPVLHIITASEKDRLRLYRWDFPITGKVTYKGFFTREDILKEKGSLEAKGYDTFVQQAGAYSTLGWLKDPIFSSMLQQDESTLANLILHEMTHATIYFKGQTDLNEQIATFVGNQGAIDFLTEKYGKESEEVVEAIHCQEDDLLFSRWIDQACQELSDFYAKEASRDERLKGREGLFHRLKEDFKGMMVSFKTESYKNFEKVDINNAVLLAYRRYIHRLESFQILYEQSGRDTRKVVEYFKAIQVSGGKVARRFAIENPESRNRKSE